VQGNWSQSAKSSIAELQSKSEQSGFDWKPSGQAHVPVLGSNSIPYWHEIGLDTGAQLEHFLGQFRITVGSAHEITSHSGSSSIAELQSKSEQSGFDRKPSGQAQLQDKGSKSMPYLHVLWTHGVTFLEIQ
jgi:hypothetical protein